MCVVHYNSPGLHVPGHQNRQGSARTLEEPRSTSETLMLSAFVGQNTWGAFQRVRTFMAWLASQPWP